MTIDFRGIPADQQGAQAEREHPFPGNVLMHVEGMGDDSQAPGHDEHEVRLCDDARRDQEVSAEEHHATLLADRGEGVIDGTAGRPRSAICVWSSSRKRESVMRLPTRG